MLPLLRAVLVWVVLLVSVIAPRMAPPVVHPIQVAVTQLSAFDRNSVVQQNRDARVEAAQMAQVATWSNELKQGLAEYEAKQQALAAAQAQAAAIAARSNHPPPLAEIAKDITDAFGPLGPAAGQDPVALTELAFQRMKAILPAYKDPGGLKLLRKRLTHLF